MRKTVAAWEKDPSYLQAHHALMEAENLLHVSRLRAIHVMAAHTNRVYDRHMLGSTMRSLKQLSERIARYEAAFAECERVRNELRSKG